jgi:hypothetical protein
VIGTPTRPLIVHSSWPADEVRTILEGLLTKDGGLVIRGSASRVTLVDGAVGGSAVTFRILPAARNAPGGREPSPLEFAGTIDDAPDGSVLWGSISAPTSLALPAAAVTVLVGFFLLWNRIPLALVAVAVVAWIFLTVIVVSSLGEQRLGEADAVGPWLEDALALTPAPSVGGTTAPSP